MKYCLKKIHQYILAIFSRIIELINFIIYIIKNFNKIKFKLEKIKAHKFLKDLETEKYNLYLKAKNMRSDDVRIKPDTHEIHFFSTIKNANLIGKHKIATKNNKFVYHSASSNSHWKFPLSWILPFQIFCTISIQSPVAIDFIKNRRIYYHHLLDTYFFYYLINKYIPKCKMIIFGGLKSWEKGIIKSLNLNNIEFIPNIFIGIQTKELIFRNEFLALRGIANDKKINNEFRKYTSDIKKFCLENNYNKKESFKKILAIRSVIDAGNPNNQQQIIKIFKSFGYKCIDWRNFSFLEQVAMAKSAKVIAGVHGSNLVNSVFVENNATIFELATVNSSDCYKILCNALNIEYKSLKSDIDKNNNYSIKEDELTEHLKTIEKNIN